MASLRSWTPDSAVGVGATVDAHRAGDEMLELLTGPMCSTTDPP